MLYSSLAQEALPLNRLSTAQLRVFLKGYPGDWRADTDRNKGVPSPAVLPPAGTLIPLPDVAELKLSPLSVLDAMKQRRSHRAFTDQSVTLEELGVLLWAAQGETVRNQDGNALRTVPSAGGRHPLDVYVVVNRVQELSSGVYRYYSEKHGVVPVDNLSDAGADLLACCYGQAAVGQAAATLVWVAEPYRTEWKYGCLAHRMIAMEAGHSCQNVYLASEVLNLGMCAMLAYDQRKLDALLQLDGRDRFAVYLAPVGKRSAP